jgi:hypothetical protein
MAENLAWMTVTSQDILSRSNETIVTLLLQRNLDDNIARQSKTSNRNSFECHEIVRLLWYPAKIERNWARQERYVKNLICCVSDDKARNLSWFYFAVHTHRFQAANHTRSVEQGKSCRFSTMIVVIYRAAFSVILQSGEFEVKW